MSEEVVLKVEHLDKVYRLGEIGTGTIAHDINRWWARVRGKEDPFSKVGTANDRTQKGEKGEYVKVLNDINFEVKKGEVLGIIGKNGAGKSTLLKVISQITSPSSGSIKAKGRIASLLEVGTGMNPEMTGKENVYLNGTILGMTKKEIDTKYNEIMEFAGCLKYEDTPVKRYSSGMKVRLGFAVAAFLEPEILIVDEVLAVGDAEFQNKAIGKMKDITEGGGRTVLFVSHNMGSIQNLCNKVMVLNQGQITSYGKVDESIGYYLNQGVISNDSKWESKSGVIEGVDVSSVKISNAQGQSSNYFTNLEAINVELSFRLEKLIKNLKIQVKLENQQGVEVLSTFHNDIKEFDFEVGENILKFSIPEEILNKGVYYLSLMLGIHRVKWLHNHERILKFEVDFVTKNNNLLQANFRKSIIAPLIEWELNK